MIRNREVIGTLAITFLGFMATFTVVSFLGPVITHMTGATGSGVGALQAFIGVGSILGLVTGGMMADRKAGRGGLIAAFIVMATSLAAYGWTLGAAPLSIPNAVAAAHICIGAAALFAIVPMILTRSTELAGPAAPLALALNGSLVSLGQGIGSLWGGAVTDIAGLAWIGPAGSAVALLGLAGAARQRTLLAKPLPAKTVSVSS